MKKRTNRTNGKSYYRIFSEGNLVGYAEASRWQKRELEDSGLVVIPAIG